MRKLNLDDLKGGLTGITEAFGTFLSEAAMYCLEANGHEKNVQLHIKGFHEENFLLTWTDELTEEVKSSWVDENEATEYGATAIALLLILKITDYKVFKRTRGATDYIISKSFGKQSASNICYLEISGIWKEHPSNTLNMRLNLKKKQVEKTVINSPAMIIVTEFGRPKSKIIKI